MDLLNLQMVPQWELNSDHQVLLSVLNAAQVSINSRRTIYVQVIGLLDTHQPKLPKEDSVKDHHQAEHMLLLLWCNTSGCSQCLDRYERGQKQNDLLELAHNTLSLQHKINSILIYIQIEQIRKSKLIIYCLKAYYSNLGTIMESFILIYFKMQEKGLGNLQRQALMRHCVQLWRSMQRPYFCYSSSIYTRIDCQEVPFSRS